MSLRKLIVNAANYNRWANESLVAWLRTKPEADLRKEVASSYPSLLATLEHIRSTEAFWHSVVAKSPVEAGPGDALDQLEAQSAVLANCVSGLSEEELMEEVPLDTPWVKGALPRYEFVQHIFTHSTYHRGQAVTIGRGLGYTDAPMTDYNFYNMVTLKRGS